MSEIKKSSTVKAALPLIVLAVFAILIVLYLNLDKIREPVKQPPSQRVQQEIEKKIIPLEKPITPEPEQRAIDKEQPEDAIREQVEAEVMQQPLPEQSEEEILRDKLIEFFSHLDQKKYLIP